MIAVDSKFPPKKSKYNSPANLSHLIPINNGCVAKESYYSVESVLKFLFDNLKIAKCKKGMYCKN
jgi:hypothetical protein